ncbi:MAG: polysaccharide biosynthesis/export family protein [Crocinitomicaceae bacterium]|nr:polysaccharide biosynthesis/export family protein [Crocinitomicaceae bacterium]
MKLTFSLLILLSLLSTLQSCKLREKMVYLQEKPTADSTQKANANFATAYAPVLRTDDLLQIQVGGQDQEALANFQFFVSNSLNNNAVGSQAGIQATQSSSAITYLVDPNGNINFPVLGFVEVAGLTRLEATIKLQNLLSEYVDGPVVNIQIRNFKITVLGQVQRPGTYTMPSDRVTVLEAIGMAGDLQLTGVRNNVLVVREAKGQRQEIRLDLTDQSIYSSPAYYLLQNDVVYVEPNKGARFQGQNVQIFTQVVTPVLSLMLSIYTLFALN